MNYLKKFKTKKAKIFAVIISNIIFLFLGLLFCEILSFLYFNYVLKEPGYLTHDSYLRIFKPSSVLPLDIKTNFSQKWVTDEFSVSVKTNTIGLRENFDIPVKADTSAGKPNFHTIDIGFIGDSFTFGHGVEAGERYSDILRNYYPEKRIISYSYRNGWAPPHYYLFLKKNPELVPGICMLGLFPWNDLSEDIEDAEIEYTKEQDILRIKSKNKKVNSEGGMISRKTINETGFSFLKRFWFGKLIIKTFSKILFLKKQHAINYRNTLDFDKGNWNQTNVKGLEFVLEIDRYLKTKNSRLIVFIIPYNFYVGNYYSHYSKKITKELFENRFIFKKLSEWFKVNEIEYIDPSIPFIKAEKKGIKLYFEQDAHWNREGHKVAGEIIARYLKN